MSRFRRAVHGVASSYVLLAATAVYVLASVPVALHYLDKERFGLWALMSTMAGYLNLVDMGMSAAAARLLIDHKDNRESGDYGSLIKTGWLVSLVQAAIILLAGLLLARTFSQLLAIPATLQREFIQLVNWQCGVLALSFATRMLGMILGAHQRMDWVNYLGVLSLLANFAGQWLLFHLGFGVLSLMGGALAGTVLVIVLQTLACHTLKLFPSPGGWGRVSGRHFKELFNFGKDMFLVAIGAQMIMTSQVIIITRLLGLEEAAIWSVGLRVFNLLSQVVWRLPQMSMAALAEMLTRGEAARLRERYRSLAVLTFSFAGWVAVSFAACNSRFVTLWTHGKILWPDGNDGLLALWMIISAVVHCHNSFVLTTKQIGFMRYIYFAEGVAFVALSCLVARWGGLPAIIVCSIICSTVFSGAYGVWRVSRFFDLSLREVAWSWLDSMNTMLLFYLPVAALAWWLSSSLPPIIQLGINAVLAGPAGLYFFLRFGIPASFQNEILRRVPVETLPLLKHVFPQTAH